jgi:hypothetical protein
MAKAKIAIKNLFIFQIEMLSISQICAKVQLYFDILRYLSTKILPLQEI